MASARMLRLVPSESALLLCDMQEKFRWRENYNLICYHISHLKATHQVFSTNCRGHTPHDRNCQIAQYQGNLIIYYFVLNELIIFEIIATEQNPKGLGPTVPELELQKYGIPIFEKTKVSFFLLHIYDGTFILLTI
jgi:hypothetical protein